MTNVRQRQQAGAGYANGVRKDRSLEKLVAAYRAMQDRGEALSPERLSSRAGVSRSTAYRHFAACQQICPIGCIDKKEDFTTLIPEKSEPPAKPTDIAVGEKRSQTETVVMDDEDFAFAVELEAVDEDVQTIERHQAWLARLEAPEMGAGASEGLLDDPEAILARTPHPAASQGRCTTFGLPALGRYRRLRRLRATSAGIGPVGS